MAHRTRRLGLTYLEVLIAAMLLVITLGAVLSQYAYSYNVAANTADLAAATGAGRDAIERVRAQGFINAPEGSTTTYYDTNASGPYTTQGTNKFRVVTTITSDKFITGTTQWADTAKRAVVVSVTNLGNGSVMFQEGTMLVRAGI